jgi:hypothetical protein
MRNRVWRAAAGFAVIAAIGCAHIKEDEKAKQEAETKGKYAVRLTEQVERVEGLCQFIKSIQPQYDPVQIPTVSQLPDYFRVKAVLAGADTVLVKGKTGEAYICGPGPLNPDGTLKQLESPPGGPPPAAPPQ